MTDEWPPAPRLTAALDDLAERARVRPSAQSDVRQVLEREADPDGPAAGEPVDVVVMYADAARRRPPRRLLLVAAAVLVLLTTVAALVLRDGEAEVDTRDQVDEDEGEGADGEADGVGEGDDGLAPATTTTPADEIRRHCDENTGPRELVLAVGDETIRLSVRGGGSLSNALFVLSADGDLGSAFPASFSDRSTTVDVVSGVDALDPAEVKTSLGGVTCGTSYLVSDEASTASALSLACAGTTVGAGFLGYVLEGVPEIPVGCQVRHPVVLLVDAAEPVDELDDELVAWEDHLGCSGRSAGADDGPLVTTSYTSCETTLLVYSVAATDPWTATVDGQPLGVRLRDVLTSTSG